MVWSRRAARVQAWRACCQGIMRTMTGFLPLRKGHGLSRTLQLPWLVLHIQHVRFTALVWAQEMGKILGLISCCAFKIQIPSSFPRSLLSGLQTWFPCLLSAFTLLTNKSQPMTGNPLPPASVSPTLFQWHSPLNINLSVSKFTNNFNA